jgi:hypothetical protein
LAVNVMAEGSETPNGEQGRGPEGRPRRSEGDLLAERRARRAAESGEVALMRRAEAAEATVQTLERHVASLQQRLREVEAERTRTDELLEAERAAAREREHELQRVKQREYAEQQLRIEAEDRVAELTAVGVRVDSESRAEIDRLDARLSASEDDARELAARLEGVQRQLAEARTRTGADEESRARDAGARAAASREGEHALQKRLVELERRAVEIQQGLAAERAAREHSEQLLENMREGHRSMELLLGEMKGILARVTGALAAQERAQRAAAGTTTTTGFVSPAIEPLADARPRAPLAPGEQPQVCQRPGSADAPEAQDPEMADALAAAVERLRARAEAAPPQDTPASAPTPTGGPPVPGATAAAMAPEEVPAGAPGGRSSVATASPSHKHSMSLIGRLRNRRKQRKSP